MKNLDLYAKIEPLIGFYEEYANLYQIYLQELKKFDMQTVLDIGCGNGSMLVHLQNNGYRAKGIDLSPKMVEIANNKGVYAVIQDLKEIDEKFDAVLAIGDVLNYMAKEKLKSFFSHVQKVLNNGGIFLADINTLFGFEEVTQGVMVNETENKFLAIDAEFENDILTTYITLFEKTTNCYQKEQDTIYQYYHKSNTIKKLTSLKQIKKREISLFSEENDKILMIFQK